MGPSQICGCPFREPRVFEIAHIYTNIYIYIHTHIYIYIHYYMEGLIAGTTAVNAIFFDFGVHTFENTPVGRHGDLGISWINLSIHHGFEDSSRFQCRDEEADSEESDFEEQACDGQWVPACSQLSSAFQLGLFCI